MRPRMGLAGCGRWGKNILRDLLSLGCETYVADPEIGARILASEAGARIVVEHLNDFPDVDGIVVATPTSTHAAVIWQALSRGVPIFVEKPMTSSLEDARELASADGTLFVMDKWRYHPGVEELRRIRESGELGVCRGMHLRHVGWGHPHRDVDVVWILAPHCLAIALEVLGEVPEVRHAFAERLRAEAVTLMATLGEEPWITLEVSSRAPAKRREFRLHCENGVAWLDEGWGDHIKIARGAGTGGGDAGSVERREVSTDLPLLRELHAFVEHVKGGPAPRSSALEGVLVVERIDEMRRMAGLFE